MARKLMPVLVSLLLGYFGCGFAAKGLSRYIPEESCDNPFTVVRDEIPRDSLQVRIDQTANYSGRIFTGDVRRLSNGSFTGRTYLDITYKMEDAIRGPYKMEITVRHFLEGEDDLERSLVVGDRVIVFCNEIGTGFNSHNIGTEGSGSSICQYFQSVSDYLQKTVK